MMNELALFAGAGGGILGSMLLGWRTVAAVEIEDYPRAVLLQRQADGILPKFPIWDDIRTFGGKPWKGKVDVITGGFPCQDISCAGKGEGITGERSGLWKEMARVIGEVRPKFAFVENSPMLLVRGIETVIGDLAEMGYNAVWGIVSAENAGALHQRKRIWILGYANGNSKSNMSFNDEAPKLSKYVSNAKENIFICDFTVKRLSNRGISQIFEQEKNKQPKQSNWWKIEPDVGRMANGMAFRVERLKAIGNGQVPQAMVLAWSILYEKMMENNG